MSDVITRIGHSLIQHGKHNDRIYLMSLAEEDFPGIIQDLDRLVKEQGYSKIFAKIPAGVKEDFLDSGYTEEAVIPKFFNGNQDAYFVGKFFLDRRKKNREYDTIQRILDEANSRPVEENSPLIASDFRYQRCDNPDAPQIAQVYQQVFETYPFPIFDPDYIRKTMEENVTYFSIREGNSIVALASTEAYFASGNVEMTDFATLPGYRGKNFSSFLLYIMEEDMRKKGIQTAYTIARSLSYGMNITFSKAGYRYSGTLVNNTNISGDFESMNVWYKHLF